MNVGGSGFGAITGPGEGDASGTVISVLVTSSSTGASGEGSVDGRGSAMKNGNEITYPD